MKKFIYLLYFTKTIFIVFLVFLNFIIVQNLIAQSDPNLQGQIQNNLNQTGIESGYGEQSMAYATEAYVGATIGLIISYVLGFIGVIFLILIIYSGFQWMTAGGNEETVTKAKKRITNSVIGLIIIFAAYIITYFITEVLITTTQYEG